ncbi:hypothetical protein OEK23_003041 [Vibrio cholerae]|nr:hypothetical protein [Vibrio cholerae]
MHKLQNGSQVSVRPQRKPLVGLGGYFSESNDQGAPSYPGQDWFNDCTDEFINALDEMGITYDQEQLDHLARAFAAVRSQEWNANVNYGIGQEVVRNNLRYIARAASGPDNGGAVMPTNDAKIWHPVLPSAYSERDESSWVKIAVVNGVQNLGGGGDFLSLEFIGWSDFGYTNRFSADIMVVERDDAFSAIVSPKTLGIQSPTFYKKRVSANNFELWVKLNSTYPCPITVIRKSRSRYSGTIAGILEKATTEPTGLTLVPYDTGYQFASIPIGMEVAFDTPPPTNDPRFRFVKLTYNDAYNTGLLTSQTLSGSAPELVSTAVISAAQSPINGQTIDMINTMGTFIRPGVTAGVRKSSQNKAHTHSEHGAGQAEQVGGGGIAVLRFVTGTTGVSGGDEANPYCLSRVFYKRIY